MWNGIEQFQRIEEMQVGIELKLVIGSMYWNEYFKVNSSFMVEAIL